MCKYKNHAPQTKNVYLRISADLSCSGEKRFKMVKIDKCIASIVEALQAKDVDMHGSCCGHESGIGEIALQDGRTLIITSIPFNEYLKKKKVLLDIINEKRE